MHCTLSALSSPAFAHWLLLSAVPRYGIMRSCRIQQRGFIRVMAEHRCCTGERWKMTVMLGYKLTPESFWMQGCACVCWSGQILFCGHGQIPWFSQQELAVSPQHRCLCSIRSSYVLFFAIQNILVSYGTWYDWSTGWLFGKGGQVWILWWRGSRNDSKQEFVTNAGEHGSKSCQAWVLWEISLSRCAKNEVKCLLKTFFDVLTHFLIFLFFILIHHAPLTYIFFILLGYEGI